jgi:hypothetical protein
MGVDSGPLSGRVRLLTLPLWEKNVECYHCPPCRTGRYPHAAWRNFRFVGTEPVDLAGDIAVAGERREDVKAFRAGR